MNGVAGKKDYWIVPVAFLAALVAFYQLAYPLLNDNDVPWHMAIGALLVDTHHLPKTDPWAYGNQNQPWFILSWVWNLMLGITQALSGTFGTFMFTLMIGAGLVAGVAKRLLDLDIARPAVIMTSLLTGLSLLDYITARPQLVGYVLAFLFHAILHKSRPSSPSPLRGEGWGGGGLSAHSARGVHPHPTLPPQGGGKKWGCLLWLPPLMLLWANAHGSFMVGFIIMGAYAAEAWFTHNSVWLKRLIVIGAACAVCALINPYGPEVALGALLSFKGAATKFTIEWMPFTFGVSTGLSVWLVMMILASNLIGAPVALADKILAIGWLLATMFSIRNGAFFILTSAPYLATCLDVQTRSFRDTRPPAPLVVFISNQPLWRVWAGCMVALALFITSCYALPHADKIEGEDFSIKDAIDFALKEYPDHHYLTDYALGGQVIYHTQGKLPFFMDSRAVTAYSGEAMEDFLDFLRLTPGWEEKLAAKRLNGLIVPNNSAFASAYDKGLYHKGWKLVFAGKRASVYIARP